MGGGSICHNHRKSAQMKVKTEMKISVKKQTMIMMTTIATTAIMTGGRVKDRDY